MEKCMREFRMPGKHLIDVKLHGNENADIVGIKCPHIVFVDNEAKELIEVFDGYLTLFLHRVDNFFVCYDFSLSYRA